MHSDWERIAILPLAKQRLEIDLDDGVKVNYLKFGGALAPIAGLAAKEDSKPCGQTTKQPTISSGSAFMPTCYENSSSIPKSFR